MNNSGTITANSGVTYNLSGGTIDGSGQVTINGAMTWTAGKMFGSGTTEIAAGKTLTFSGAGNGRELATRTLSNFDTVALTETGSLFVRNGAVINNQSGALFDIPRLSEKPRSVGFHRFIEKSDGLEAHPTAFRIASQTDADVDLTAGSVTINNAGTFQKSAGTGTTLVEGTINQS